jgi:hypothetical protein
VAVVALARLVGLVLLGAAHQPRLDAELAEAQRVVGLEVDRGPGQQGDPLAPRVLEQVARELAPQLGLVALELLAILRGEPDHVLVGRVRARQRGDLVLLHLPRQLARDLDRAHLGLEGARERPLDEAREL